MTVINRKKIIKHRKTNKTPLMLKGTYARTKSEILEVCDALPEYADIIRKANFVDYHRDTLGNISYPYYVKARELVSVNPVRKYRIYVALCSTKEMAKKVCADLSNLKGYYSYVTMGETKNLKIQEGYELFLDLLIGKYY